MADRRGRFTMSPEYEDAARRAAGLEPHRLKSDDPDYGARMDALEAEQASVIAEVRSYLSDEENSEADDKLIWQRAVRFGPNTPEGHAQSLRNALAAADEYGAALEQELGLVPDRSTLPDSSNAAGGGEGELANPQNNTNSEARD